MSCDKSNGGLFVYPHRRRNFKPEHRLFRIRMGIGNPSPQNSAVHLQRIIHKGETRIPFIAGLDSDLGRCRNHLRQRHLAAQMLYGNIQLPLHRAALHPLLIQLQIEAPIGIDPLCLLVIKQLIRHRLLLQFADRKGLLPCIIPVFIRCAEYSPIGLHHLCVPVKNANAGEGPFFRFRLIKNDG
ncbi:hypothetical protein D3C75_780120 [compost metagenome]